MRTRPRSEPERTPASKRTVANMDVQGDAVKLVVEAARSVAKTENERDRALDEAAQVEQEIESLESHLLPQLKKKLAGLNEQLAVLADRTQVGHGLLNQTAENLHNATTAPY